MAAKLATNRAGRLTHSQRRAVMTAGIVTGALLLCPLAMVIQAGALALTGALPPVTVGGILFFVVGALFLALFAGLIGTNAAMFLPEAFGRNPVRSVRGPLEIRMTDSRRPELPFSYIIGDYSFAPYVVPGDVPLRPGAPYLVYYSARSRLLLSIAALDAPDAEQWQPAFDNQGAG